MLSPAIPVRKPAVKTQDIHPDEHYQDLRIVRCQSDPEALAAYEANRFQFQHEPELYTPLRATLCRKGAASNYRLAVTVHPTMKMFTELVRYDPANPPEDDYDAHDMKEAHKQTQSDFKGQKKANAADFKNYLLEGIAGARTLYLPTVTGWQSRQAFDRTIFVAFDEDDPNALYGRVYLPKAPIMQSDGQTQTAAVFQVARTADAVESGALSSLLLTLEIELNVDERKAGQSFADRNGRGSKKNKNLVIGLDTSSALSDLRLKAVAGTVFEGRVNNGRSSGATLTATNDIVDLSAIEQMLLNVVSYGAKKPEHFKHHHVGPFLPYAREYLGMLTDLFAADWPHPTPPNRDPYRMLYVHGWAFCLKALALAYHRSRIDKLGPLAASIGSEHLDLNAKLGIDQKFLSRVESAKAQMAERGTLPTPEVGFEELKDRLRQIDWYRYRRHWIALTGASMKGGKKKSFKLKETGETKVVAQSPNTPAMISVVADKILSASWKDLCSAQDEPAE